LETAVNNYPEDIAQAQAVVLARRITDMLSGITIESEYSTTQKEELETLAISEMILREASIQGITTAGGGRAYEVANFETPLNVRRRIQTQQTGPGWSSQTFDMVSKGQNSSRYLELSVNALARMTQDADFAQNVIAFETTTDNTGKFVARVSREMWAQRTQATEETFAAAAAASIDAIENMILAYQTKMGSDLAGVYNEIGKLFKASGTDPITGQEIKLIKDATDIYDQAAMASIGGKWTVIDGSKGSQGTAESIDYIVRQTVDRVRRLLLEWSQPGDPVPASYAYSVPVNRFTIGYITIWGEETSQGSGVLGGLHHAVRFVSTELDGTPFEWLKPYLTVIPSMPTWTSLHSNVLLMDAAMNLGFNEATIARIADDASQAYANRMAIQGDRGYSLGSSLHGHVYAMSSGWISQAPIVSALEILSTQQVAAELQRQCWEYFNSPNIQNEFSEIYSDATGFAGRITDMWQNSVPNMSAPLPTLGGSTDPYIARGGENLARIGMPFWMTMGRDPMAYKIFKTGGSEVQSEFTKRGLWDPRHMYEERIQHQVGQEMRGAPLMPGVPEGTITPTEALVTKNIGTVGRVMDSHWGDMEHAVIMEEIYGTRWDKARGRGRRTIAFTPAQHEGWRQRNQP
jgi:hypothetical protein